MRLIDADALKDAVLENGITDIFNLIKNAPTVIWCSETSEGLPLMDLRPKPQVAYLCKYHKEPHYCKHTTRIEDALNFVKLEDGKYLEVERSQGKWGKWVITEIQCPNCLEYFLTDCYSTEELNKCPSCNAKMKGGAE